MVNDADLFPPIGLAFRAAVQPDLADVTGLGQQRVEQRQLTDTLVGDLRVQAQGRPDAAIPLGERNCSTPRLGGRSHGQDVGFRLRAAACYGDGVRIEVEVTVEIDGRDAHGIRPRLVK